MGLLRWWHRWLGLVIVPTLTIAFLTGALLVYQKNLITGLVLRDAQLPAGYDIDSLTRELQQVLQHPLFQPEDLIKAPNAEEPYWSLRHGNGEKILLGLGNQEHLQQTDSLLTLLETVRHIHLELMAGTTGKILLLISAVLGVFLTVSGLWLWWPTRRSMRWYWVLPPPSRWKLKLFLRFHSHSGIALATMLAIVLSTSSVMMWRKVGNTFTAPPTPVAVAESTRAFSDTDVTAVAEAVALVVREIPHSWPTYIRLDTPTDANSGTSVRVRVRLQGEWHPNGRTRAQVNVHPLEIISLSRADAVSPGEKLLNQMYPLHSGYGMPALYQAGIFFTGMGGLWLVMTGTTSLVRRLRMQRKTQKA